MGVHIFWREWFLSPFIRNSIMDMLSDVIALFLIFWVTSMLFLVLDASIYTPTSSVRIFLFLHILTNTCHFDNIYSNKCKIIFYFNLVYIYLMISDIASYFMYVLVNCTFFLGKCLLRSFVYFYSDLFIFFLLLNFNILDITPWLNLWFANIFSV